MVSIPSNDGRCPPSNTPCSPRFSPTRIVIILIALSCAALEGPRPALLLHKLALIGVLVSYIVLRHSSHHLSSRPAFSQSSTYYYFSFVNDHRLDLKKSDKEGKQSHEDLCERLARYTTDLKPWNPKYGAFVQHCVTQMAIDEGYKANIEKTTQEAKEAQEAKEREAKEGGGKTQSG